MDTIVAHLKKYAETSPEKIAVIAEDIQMSYGDLWKEVRGFASYLRSFGFDKTSRIVVKAFPSIGYAVSLFACHLAGYVFVPVEKAMGPGGVKDVAATLSASMLISDENVLDSCVFVDHADVRRIASENIDNNIDFELPTPDDLCDILFTTGTTGKSKGVVLSHRAVYAGADNNLFADELTESTVYLIASPINHASGIRRFYSCILCGGTSVLLDGFMNLKKYYQAINEYGVTALLLPPSAVRVLLAVSAKELEKYADQIELIHSGSAAMPETDKETLIRIFPNSRLVFSYGSSEAGCSCSYNYAKYPGLVNCVGVQNPHARVFIVDDDRKEINSSKDNLGLIAISGDNLMEGYYDAPELTAETLKDGVVYTNDIGYIDENGFIFMLARRGDVINVGGLKIAPIEVENVVMRYPGVVECACFGIPDKINGLVPKLNVVCDPNQPIDMVLFRSYLQKHLEFFKVPKAIDFVDELPKTANGKLDRKNLK